MSRIKNGKEGEEAYTLTDECLEELLPIDFYDKSRKPRDEQKIEFMVGKEKSIFEGERRRDFVDIVSALEVENLKMEAEIGRLAEKEDRIDKENNALKDILYGILSKLSS
ncbi:hypothetical protein EROM_070800 [Encephalitozoon romaleae SJ-2008]|uniref:Uncharacterized protein n=1 Tax=Encephalitozoon romaleae (strain SJ-2008) TaxID=1178016 RepID=I6ZUH2_ENCRO|nr:hypothetical protein EROM_070800 [Encephalitozoon romaleae SJ-2008]AFN83331.1 hypothetical protein EROM_070800 [Encephalitozoon romaleae SJ-2008]